MDEIFWLGQFFWVMFLACGGYLALVYADLADEESAKTAAPTRVGTAAALHGKPGSRLAPSLTV